MRSLRRKRCPFDWLSFSNDWTLTSFLGRISIFHILNGFFCLSQTGKAVLRGDAAGVWSGQRDWPGAHPDRALECRVPGWHANSFQTNGEGLPPLHQQRRHPGNCTAGRGKSKLTWAQTWMDMEGSTTWQIKRCWNKLLFSSLCFRPPANTYTAGFTPRTS